MKSIIGTKKQTAIDIAIKYYGSVEGLNMLIEDNVYAGESIANLENLEGRTIRIREDAQINKSVSDYFVTKEIVTV